MALIKTGNALTNALQQSGASVSNDGYGLLTSTVTWTGDEAGTPILKGSDHPELGFMKAWKVQRNYRSASLIDYKVDYVGICSETAETGVWVSADYTVINVSGATSLQTEAIQNHKSFFGATVPTGASADDFMIAGFGTGTAAAPVFPASTLVPTEFVGLHGAHFAKANGTKFTGFKDPNYQAFYGKGSYLAPTTGLSGIIYTTEQSFVQLLISFIGKSSEKNAWQGGGPGARILVPEFLGTDWEGAFGGQLLMSAVNFEEYGHVYKCSYQIRINEDGWPRSVYPYKAI